MSEETEVDEGRKAELKKDRHEYAEAYGYDTALNEVGLRKAVLRSLDDTGNGLRFVRQYVENVRYVHEDKWWVMWDGSRWCPDILGEAKERAKDTARSIYRESADWPGDTEDDADIRVAIAKWAKSSGSDAREESMLRSARTDPRLAISAVSLDSDVWLLACPNGTVDLRTGKLQEANREDHITKSTHVDFDPDAKCPQWEAFLEWAMSDQLELVEFMQRALGMSLCGDVSERVVLFLHGQGDNGKTVVLKTVCQIFGDYGLRMSSATLEAAKFAKGGSSHSDDIARLKGRRFVYASELEDGTKLATALLKDFTGDEGKLTARAIYKGTFEFKPEFTPWIGANHKPLVPSDDQAIWNRMRLVPFDAIIETDKKDKGLFDRLVTEEGPGILAWLVRGCVEWHRNGLPTPEAVMEATDEYRNDMDTFGEFLDHIVASVSTVYTPAALRETYNSWAKDNTDDEARLTQRAFKAHMLARGWTLEMQSSGKRKWTPPVVQVRRTNWGELARLGAEHVSTAEELSAYEAEVRAIAEKDLAEALDAGFGSVEEMHEQERLNSEAEAS